MAGSKSFEELFHETRPGLHRRLWRDLRCLVYLGRLIWLNVTVGRKVRRKYLACKSASEPFWLDEGNV